VLFTLKSDVFLLRVNEMSDETYRRAASPVYIYHYTVMAKYDFATYVRSCFGLASD
jgi:hypothetical protein